MENYTEYKMPQYRLGIDDLKNHYAFSYRATGESLDSNSVEEYKNSYGWLGVNGLFKDIDYLNQEKVYEKSNEILLENLNRIRKLTDSNEYGKFVDGMTVKVEYDPLYDTIKDLIQESMMTHRYEILDLNKLKK